MIQRFFRFTGKSIYSIRYFTNIRNTPITAEQILTCSMQHLCKACLALARLFYTSNLILQHSLSEINLLYSLFKPNINLLLIESSFQFFMSNPCYLIRQYSNVLENTYSQTKQNQTRENLQYLSFMLCLFQSTVVDKSYSLTTSASLACIFSI